MPGKRTLRKKRLRIKHRKIIRRLKTHCRACELRFPINELTFHHVFNKKNYVGYFAGNNILFYKELRKCVVVCEECHKMFHEQEENK